MVNKDLQHGTKSLPIILALCSMHSGTYYYNRLVPTVLDPAVLHLVMKLTDTATNLCCFNFKLHFTAPFSCWYCNWFHTSILDLSVQHKVIPTGYPLIIVAKCQSDV